MSRPSARPLSGAAFVALSLLLAACGGPPPTPTPIPADVVRPQQPTPAYSNASPEFRLTPATPETVIIVTPVPTTDFAPIGSGPRRTGLAMRQPPSAMGIATGGVTLLDAPGGAPVASVPPGGALTVTGRSQDGAWLAAFTSNSAAGWIPAGSVVLYGDSDLTVVDFAFSPAPVATLLAEAMQPVASPISAYLTRRPDGLQQAATPEPGAPEGRAAGGQVVSEGRLNVRAAPALDAAVAGQLEPGSALVVLGRSADGAWLSVRQGGVAGWAAAEFVRVDADPATLPVLP